MEKVQSDLSELRKQGEDASATIKLLNESLARLDQILEGMERRRAAQTPTPTATTPTPPSDHVVAVMSAPAVDADGSVAAATNIKETWIGTGHGEDHGPATARVASVPPPAATTKAPASPSVPVAPAAASDAPGDLPLPLPTSDRVVAGLTLAAARTSPTAIVDFTSMPAAPAAGHGTLDCRPVIGAASAAERSLVTSVVPNDTTAVVHELCSAEVVTMLPPMTATTAPTLSWTSPSERVTNLRCHGQMLRPMPWPSFRAGQLTATVNRPRPWPLFREINCCESPSSTMEKAFRQCSSGSFRPQGCAAIELQISDFSDHTTLVWFSCTISRFHLRAMVRNPELKFLSTGPTPEAFVSYAIHGATYGLLADWHLQNQIIWTRAPTASITEWILTPWDPGQELVLSDFTKVSCSQAVHDTYLKELMLQNLNVSTSKKLKFQSIYFDHTLLTTHKPRPAAQGMCTKLPICESPDGPCCCVLSGLHLHSTISLAGSGSVEWGCHQAVFCRVLSELLLHLGWTCYTTRHQSGHETLYNKQVWELAMDTYLRGHLREKNSVTWLFVVWTRLGISSCISIVLLLSSYGPNGIGYRLLGSIQVDIAFWPEYVLIRSNEMPATRKFPHAHYLAGLPIITSPTFQNAVNCSLANCKVCRRNLFVILIHISALPRPEFSGLISGRTLAPSFVSSQILMTVQIGWLPSFPAYFVTNELSNEDNSDCCFSCWYRGEPALFLFWAFDRHAVFQGRRCAMISIICCLVYQSDIDNLVYLHSNGLKVLQVTGDPGVCNVPSSVGTQEVQLRIPWDPGGYYGLKILKSHGEAVDDPWGQGSQKEGVMSCTRPCWSTKTRFSGYSALVGPACKGVEGEKGYISQYHVPTQGVN